MRKERNYGAPVIIFSELKLSIVHHALHCTVGCTVDGFRYWSCIEWKNGLFFCDLYELRDEGFV